MSGDRPEELASDKTLVKLFQGGQENAATEMYLRYANRLFGLVRNQISKGLEQRVDAEEVVQSVFRTFFRRAQKGQYDLPMGEELWRLLLVIALNKIRSVAEYHHAQRRDIRKTEFADVSRIEAAISNSQTSDEESFAILQMIINDLLGDFSDVKAEMIRLRITGCEVEEIASQTQRSKRTVERTLQDFRARLKGELEGVSPD